MPRYRFVLVPFLLVASVRCHAQPLPVSTIEFAAETVGRDMKYNVVLPAGYDASQRRYPVLYLLHGLTSNYTAWARMGVPGYARQYDRWLGTRMTWNRPTSAYELQRFASFRSRTCTSISCSF